MKKETVSKKICQRVHAKRRFEERTGIVFNKSIRRFFVKKIQMNQARMIIKQSNRVGVFEVEYNEEFYKVVYDNKRHNIITVLPGQKGEIHEDITPSQK